MKIFVFTGAPDTYIVSANNENEAFNIIQNKATFLCDEEFDFYSIREYDFSNDLFIEIG